MRPWPYDPDVAQVNMVDHHMIPTSADVDHWAAEARRRNARSIRSGAVFPRAAEAFRDAGWSVMDELALLRLELEPLRARPVLRPLPPWRPHATSRMRPRHFPELAALDRAAFGDPWGNDATSLGDIAAATPRHRSRVISARSASTGGSPALQAFAICGLSGSTGYVQRLAVRPDEQGRGFGNALLDDGLDWMRRRGAAQAMVNTGVDNTGALKLYERAGFVRCREQLTILELPLD